MNKEIKSKIEKNIKKKKEKKSKMEAVNINPGTEPDDPSTESIWDEDTLERVKNFATLTEDIENSRAALNAKLAAGKAVLVDEGFNKDALDAAIKYAKTPEEKRENFDLTYMYCRKALGIPVQDDLFVAAMQHQVSVVKTKEDQD